MKRGFSEYFKVDYTTPCANWDSYSGNGSDNGRSYYDSDWTPRTNKRTHKFSPVLLIFSTVWNCSECGKKKEDCLTNYCEDEDNPPNWDLGGW